MGKYTIYRRRGGASHAGLYAAPGTPDWSLSVISDTAIDIIWSGVPPTGATRIWSRSKLHSTSTWGSWIQTATTPVHYTGLTASTTYDFQCAWGTAALQQSEPSDIKSATTLS